MLYFLSSSYIIFGDFFITFIIFFSSKRYTHINFKSQNLLDIFAPFNHQSNEKEGKPLKPHRRAIVAAS